MGMVLINTATGQPESRPINAGGSIGHEDDSDRPERTTAPEAVSVLSPEVVAAAMAAETPTEAQQAPPELPATAAAAMPAPAPVLPAAPAPVAPRATVVVVDRIAVARAALIAAGLPTDVVDGTPPKLIGPGVIARAATATTAAAASTWHWSAWTVGLVKSVRTLLFFGCSAALGILDKLQEIDISGVLSKWTGTTVTPADTMVFLGIAGIMLRLVTTTPAFARWRKASEGAGGSDSKVDDPT